MGHRGEKLAHPASGFRAHQNDGRPRSEAQFFARLFFRFRHFLTRQEIEGVGPFLHIDQAAQQQTVLELRITCGRMHVAGGVRLPLSALIHTRSDVKVGQGRGGSCRP